MKSGLRVDPLLLASILALVGLGVVVIYSSSGPLAESRNLPPSFYLFSHLKKVAVGLVVFGIGMTVDHSFWKSWSRPIFLTAAVLLVFLLVSGAGMTLNGAKRWISLGGFDFQPSELMKLALFFLLARKLSEAGDEIGSFKVGFVRPMALVFVVFLLILLQPNYSMAASIFLVSVVVLFVAGTKIGHMAVLGAMALPAVGFLAVSSPYRLKRIMSFIDPAGNEAGGYQQLQSLISLGNGGLFGRGLGEGTQTLGYLHLPFTDTIYAILGEELGFIGTMGVLVLFAIVFWRGMVIARSARSRFGCFLATALTVSLCVNVLVHVGVCTRLLPPTGQPLPLVSFGGTSLVVNLFAMGILLNISNLNSGTSIRELPSGRLA